MRIRSLFISLLILTTLSACGNKGPVRPLETLLPGPASELELRQQGEALLLGWRLPTQNLDGSAINSPPQLDIYRMTFDPGNDCPECFDRSTLLVSIDPELPVPARKVGERYLYLDNQIDPGTGYQYKLIARNADGEAGRPVVLRQAATLAVAAPAALQGEAHDRSVLLSWQPVSLEPGDSLLGYRIYRRRDDSPSAPYPLSAKPQPETRFEDFSLENGARYHYQVRALIKRGELQIEGLATAELTIVPQAGR